MAITGSVLAAFAVSQVTYICVAVPLGSVFGLALVCLSQVENSLFRWAVLSFPVLQGQSAGCADGIEAGHAWFLQTDPADCMLPGTALLRWQA